MNLTATVELGEHRLAFGSKTYELSLTRNYVSRWGMAQAVREFLQNALDSESPLVYEFAKDDGDPSDWGEDCPSEENHLIECRECKGTGRV